jgi:hypothetical protein
MGADDLAVEAIDDEIVVTKSGTDYLIGYKKFPDQPHLIVTRSWMSSSITSPAISQFRARALQAAVTKARGLGWIV